jgi:hypothetical protein
MFFKMPSTPRSEDGRSGSDEAGRERKIKGFGGSMLSVFFQPHYDRTPMSHHQLEEIEEGERKHLEAYKFRALVHSE